MQGSTRPDHDLKLSRRDFEAVWMRIEGENGWLELLRRGDEEAFDVRSSVGDFAARNPRIWIGANDQLHFLGEEFELVARVVDALGHVSVEGLIGRRHYFDHRYDRLLLRFGFALDPTDLPRLVRDVASLLA